MYKLLKKSLLSILIIMNLGVVVALLLSVLNSSLDPNKFALIDVLSIAFPYWLVANIAFVLIWALVKVKYAFLSVAALIASFGQFKLHYQNNDPSPLDGSELKVMTFNIRSFNKYSWLKEDSIDQKLLDFFKKESPDVLLLQEFYYRKSNSNTHYLKRTLKALDFKYFAIEETKDRDGKYFGLATFSRFPIKNTERNLTRANEFKNTYIRTDLKTPDGPLSVYNVHLRSIGLSYHEYELAENYSSSSNEDKVNISKSMIHKLNLSLKKRTLEKEDILTDISKNPNPCIVGGDFNSNPESSVYYDFKAKLSDAYTEKGNGWGYTYNGSGLIPPMRIDYLWSSPEQLTVKQFKAPHVKLSDHDPIIAFYSFVK